MLTRTSSNSPNSERFTDMSAFPTVWAHYTAVLAFYALRQFDKAVRQPIASISPLLDCWEMVRRELRELSLNEGPKYTLRQELHGEMIRIAVLALDCGSVVHRESEGAPLTLTLHRPCLPEGKRKKSQEIAHYLGDSPCPSFGVASGLEHAAVRSLYKLIAECPKLMLGGQAVYGDEEVITKLQSSIRHTLARVDVICEILQECQSSETILGGRRLKAFAECLHEIPDNGYWCHLEWNTEIDLPKVAKELLLELTRSQELLL